MANRLAQICPHGMVGFQGNKSYLTHRFRSDSLSLLLHSIGGWGETQTNTANQNKTKTSSHSRAGKNRLFFDSYNSKSYITKAVDTGMGGKSGSFLQPLYHNIQLNSVLQVVIFQSYIPIPTVYPLIKKY